MKMYIRANTDNILELNIDINYAPIELLDIAATKITPLYKDNGDIDDSAWGDFQSFVANVFAVLDYYDFDLRPGPKDNGGSKGNKEKTIEEPRSKSSYYFWMCHSQNIQNNDVPFWIRVRISNHIQKNVDPELVRKQKKEAQEFLETHKLPPTKRRQKYKEWEIIVNEERYASYEDALDAIEANVYRWMNKLHIDMSDYEEPIGPW